MKETKKMIFERLIENTPKTLPQEVDNFIDRCFENYEYIFYDKKNKYCFCSSCKKAISARYKVYESAHHNNSDACPVCGKQITYKCIGRMKSKKACYWKPWQPAGMKHNINLLIIQKCDDEFFVLRRFVIVKQTIACLNAKTVIRWTENQRVFFNGVKRYNLVARTYFGDSERKVHWEESTKTSWSNPDDWNDFQTPIGEFEYLGNVSELVQKSYLQYAMPYKNIIRSSWPTLDYLSKWKRVMEYLFKAGMTHAAEGYLSEDLSLTGKEKKIHQILKISPDMLQMVKAQNMYLHDIKDIRYLQRCGIKKITTNILQKYNKCRSEYGQVRFLVNIDLMSFMKFYDKVYNGSWRVHSEYMDYLSACKELGYDMTSEDVLFPANLPEAHDRETARIVEFRSEKKKKEFLIISDRFQKENERYAWKKDDLFIRMIKDYAELLKEGSDLCHCVGSFASRIKDAETTVLVIRKTNEPDKAYYTLEYRNNMIIQFHGYKNEREQGYKRDPEVELFVEGWKKEMNRRENAKKYSNKNKAAAMAIAI